MIDAHLILAAMQAVGGPAALIASIALWRLDRRLQRLEILVDLLMEGKTHVGLVPSPRK